MRPYWKGYLKLALVSCPIALHAACSSAERIAFRQINKATGNRLRQQLIDEETREPVAPEHKSRGYEVAKGHYLIVEEALLAPPKERGAGGFKDGKRPLARPHGVINLMEALRRSVAEDTKGAAPRKAASAAPARKGA